MLLLPALLYEYLCRFYLGSTVTWCPFLSGSVLPLEGPSGRSTLPSRASRLATAQPSPQWQVASAQWPRGLKAERKKLGPTGIKG